jgi:hypothetical protein
MTKFRGKKCKHDFTPYLLLYLVMTLTTFPSTNPTASLKAIEAIAAAVYGPTPGNCRNFSAVVGMMPFISLTTYSVQNDNMMIAHFHLKICN